MYKFSLTQPNPQTYNPIEEFDLIGTITCQRCVTKRIGKVCPKCGWDTVFIKIDFKGKRYRFFYDQRGNAYTFKAAVEAQLEIDRHIRDKVFNPLEWLPKAIEERKFENAYDKWLSKKAGKVSPATFKTLTSYNKNHFTFFSGKDVRDIKLKDLQSFYDELPAKLSNKFKKNLVDCLRAFFRWLLRWGELKELPIMPEIAEADSIPRQAIDYSTQIEALHRIPEQHRDIIEFLMESGLRPGEAAALKILDICFKTRTMLVQRTYSANVLRETTKGRHKMRIPLSDRACEIIQRNLNDRTGDHFIFINPVTGRGYFTEFMRRVWRQHSGIENDLYSCTRHSFCTQLVELGMSEIEAQGIMRHKDSRSTRAYYHPTQERQRQFLNRRGNVIDLSDRRATDKRGWNQ